MARTARRRHLTVLFADLSEFTALTGSLEPEYCVEIVDHLKRCAERIIPKHGGTVVGFRGDGVLAMFGFPEPSEHDGRRATEAALELRDAIRRVDGPDVAAELPPMTLHSGIHCGLVLLIENDPPSGGFELIGETPNVAARLSDIAARDEILLSTATLGGERHFFDVRERGELALEGKLKPVSVIQVLGHSAANTRYEARTRKGLTPFVGRRREFDLLDQYLHEAIGGVGREVAVVAAAGVGKTRLIEQFLQHAAQLPVHICRGYCENNLGAEPRQPFVQMVRQLQSQNGGDAPAEVIEALATGSSAPRSRDETARAFCGVFAALAVQRPLVLFIDDWQWADDATKQVLARIRDTAFGSVLILLASREPLPDAVDRDDVRTLLLTPMDDRESAQTILRLRPDADPFVVKQIQELSGGNPLFIEELCHWTSREYADHETIRGDSLPAWLSTLIESRVGRLPPAQAELVRAAAVIGTIVPTWLLEQVSGYHEHDAIFAELARQDLMFPGEVTGTVRFKHGVTRDVIYASVGLRERERLHLRIAHLLEQRSREGTPEALLEPLSYHFRAGADLERAAHYAELAGDKALAAPAPDRARSQYSAALAALDALPPSDRNYARWSQIVHRFGLACVFDPMRDHLQLFVRAADMARQRQDHAGTARAEYWLGFIHYALGDPGDAIEHYEFARCYCARALERARSAGDGAVTSEMGALAVQLLATIGLAHASAGQHDTAIALLDEALEIKRRHRRSAHPAVGSAYALACKGAVLGDRGQFARAYECFDEALEAIRGHTVIECSVISWLSAVYLWHGRWQDAHETAVRVQVLAQGAGSFYIFAMSRAVAAYATWVQKRLPASIDEVIRSTSWLEERDTRLWISLSYGWLADMTAAAGRAPEARLYAARAIRRGRAQDSVGVPMAYRALATLPQDRRHRTPGDYLALAMQSAIARGSPREQAITLLHQAQQAAGDGRLHEASQVLERARTGFASMGMSWHDAAAAAVS